jgi:hypothetical protein
MIRAGGGGDFPLKNAGFPEKDERNKEFFVSCIAFFDIQQVVALLQKAVRNAICCGS